MSDYGGIIGQACPGALADSSTYNIDGACFAEWDNEFRIAGMIPCGVAVHVHRIIEGHYKEVSCKFANEDYDVAYGVAMRSQYLTTTNADGLLAYESGDPVNVITHGRAWLITHDIEQAPEFGSHVHLTPGGLASLRGFEVAGWCYTGGFCKLAANLKIVEVQISQSGAHMHRDKSIYVNGAVITANRESPQRYDQTVRFTVEVSPIDATNKAGEWTASSEFVTINKIHDHSVEVKGKDGSGFIGKFFVYWTATDGSGVQAMLPFEFSAT